MNMNEILEQIQNFDLHSVISELGESGHVLTQTEIIVLAAAAVAGILLAMFGFRIVRFWSGLLGLLAGLAGGAAAAFYAGMDEAYVWIPGAVLGIVLAALGAKLYRFGVFLTAWIAVGAVCQYVIRPSDWMWTAGCAAAGLIAGLFAIKFVKAVTILATAVFGGAISGTALYYLLPLKWEWFHVLLCVLLGAVGALIQILFVSGRRKKQNLKKAAEIREANSTENEVEKARALVEDLEKEEESDEPQFLDSDLFMDDEGEDDAEYIEEEESVEVTEFFDEEDDPDEEKESDGYGYPDEDEEQSGYEYLDEDGESDGYEYLDEDEESDGYEYLDEDEEADGYEYLDRDKGSDEYEYLDDDDEIDYLDDPDDLYYLDDEDEETK